VALETFTVRQALEGANARLVLLQTNPILQAAEQALCGELVNVNTLALNALRADNTIVPGQRLARGNAIDDKVRALGTVCDAHQHVIPVDAFYNALDLSTDAAEAIRLGLPSFRSDISTIPGD
jgi:hypothetical protein